MTNCAVFECWVVIETNDSVGINKQAPVCRVDGGSDGFASGSRQNLASLVIIQ
jgi:hypothetical protein